MARRGFGSRGATAVAVLWALAVGCGRTSEDVRAVGSFGPRPSPPGFATATTTGTALERAPRLVILAGGDVNLGRGTGQRILADATFDPFAAMRPLLEQGDLVFANLESPLSEQGGETRHPTKPLSFVGPPESGALLRRGPFHLVSLANNHVWDYGRRAFIDTLDILDAAGVRYAGASRRADQQYTPTVLDVRGWSVAVVAVTQVWNPGPFDTHEAARHVAWAHPEPLARAVSRARSEHDVVLVSYHGGREYSEFPAREALELARVALESGADAVLAHHPHVPQGIGWDGARPIFYSLGNLVFGEHRDHPWTGRSFLARLTFSEHGLDAAACPYRIDRELPRPIEAHEQELFARHVRRTSSFASVAGTKTGTVDAAGCFSVRPERGPSEAFGPN